MTEDLARHDDTRHHRGVQVGVLHQCAQGPLSDARKKTRDEPHPRTGHVCLHLPQVAGMSSDVGVAHHHQVMARLGEHRAKVTHLGVDPAAAVVHDDARIDIGTIADETAYERRARMSSPWTPNTIS